jgi:SAM-dependent methyltransferase
VDLRVAPQTPFPVGSFDLVSMQYPALSKAAGDAAVRALLDTVRPGGLLLAVYHDLDDERRERMKSRDVDPADYVGAERRRHPRLPAWPSFPSSDRAATPRLETAGGPSWPHIVSVALIPGRWQARRAPITRSCDECRLRGLLHADCSVLGVEACRALARMPAPEYVLRARDAAGAGQRSMVPDAGTRVCRVVLYG